MLTVVEITEAKLNYCLDIWFYLAMGVGYLAIDDEIISEE